MVGNSIAQNNIYMSGICLIQIINHLIFLLLHTVPLFMRGETEQWYSTLIRSTYLKYYGIFSPKTKEKNEEKKGQLCE